MVPVPRARRLFDDDRLDGRLRKLETTSTPRYGAGVREALARCIRADDTSEAAMLAALVDVWGVGEAEAARRLAAWRAGLPEITEEQQQQLDLISEHDRRDREARIAAEKAGAGGPG
jgi:hypothetical protein